MLYNVIYISLPCSIISFYFSLFHFLKRIYYILFIFLLTVCHSPPEYMLPEIKNLVYLAHYDVLSAHNGV